MKMKQSERILVVCAHPDDETLGLGGTLALHAQKGNMVSVLVFADGQFGRDKTPKGIKDRQDQAKKACSILGLTEIKFLNYEDQKLDVISLVDLVFHIELAIKKLKPDTVYTHYWGDANQDHRKVFEASLIATRPTPTSTVKRFICFETPSSTEWGNNNFKPNLFIKIDQVINKKLRAVKQYKKEINSFPHPRSTDAIINRAHFWGSSVGVNYAEAFVTIREIQT